VEHWRAVHHVPLRRTGRLHRKSDTPPSHKIPRLPDTFRAMAKYRDFDGRTRTVEGYGKTRSVAANKLRQQLKERAEGGRHGQLTAMHRFSVAADLWLERFRGMVAEGLRSAGSLETYERQLRNHVLPALVRGLTGSLAHVRRTPGMVAAIVREPGVIQYRSERDAR
jgi:hypothetical protein